MGAASLLGTIPLTNTVKDFFKRLLGINPSGLQYFMRMTSYSSGRFQLVFAKTITTYPLSTSLIKRNRLNTNNFLCAILLNLYLWHSHEFWSPVPS